MYEYDIDGYLKKITTEQEGQSAFVEFIGGLVRTVTGFDNIPSASYVVPALTTVAQDGDAMGRLAAEILIEAIAKPEGEPRMVKLEPRLIVRQSCLLPEV